MHEGKGDLRLRRWEARMPKPKAVATKEKGDVASLVEGKEGQTDGMYLLISYHQLQQAAVAWSLWLHDSLILYRYVLGILR